MVAAKTITRPERYTVTRRSNEVPSVLAVVVTHNGRRWLKESLVALAGQTYPRLDVLVVDDDSPDAFDEPRLKRVVKRHLRRRRWGYVRTPMSLGYGGAINWALSRVRTDADYLLFIHDDAALTAGSVGALVRMMESDPRIAVAGPKIVSWNDPDVLEEIGMRIDRFGYPYKGLETDEIDLGQYEDAVETFFVTSTCMLVRHDVFSRLQGWDARLGAFGEDLDLCWRARLAGYTVRFEPKAKARHAIAMATGQRPSKFQPARYFIRRNRLRTVAKNVSGVRMLLLIPQFLLLSLAEMVGFLILRQPREVGNLARALLWNLGTIPSTVKERWRAQRSRKVPDEVINRLNVSEVARLHASFAQKRGSLEGAWGRRTELVAARTTRARALRSRVQVVPLVASAVLVIAVFLGFRNFILAPPVSVGELLPFPDGAFTMFGAWSSPWRDISLGTPGPAPPAMVMFGMAQFLALGAEGFAQKVMILILGAAAFIGAYRLALELVDRWARLACALIYVLGAVGYAGMRTGSLGALTFGAAAPFALHSMLRLAGWERPPQWSEGREVARLAVFGAISAMMVPGSLILYGFSAVALSMGRAIIARIRAGRRALGRCLLGLFGAWALLFPWSVTWFTAGGAFELLGSRNSGPTFAAEFSGHGLASVLLGQTPDGPELFGAVLPVLGVLAVVVASGARRRLALALWSVVLTIGLTTTVVAKGAIDPPVATPTEIGVLASIAYAGLAAVAVAAFRLDLPRRNLGASQFVVIAGLAVTLFGAVAGLVPSFIAGAWEPGQGLKAENEETITQIETLLAAEASGGEHFRVLWVGEEWNGGPPTVTRPSVDNYVTASTGEVLTDLFEPTETSAENSLDNVIGAVESNSIDQAGRRLGAFNIRYVVLENGPRARFWLNQRDLTVARAESDYWILEDENYLPRAAAFSTEPNNLKPSQAATAPTTPTGQTTGFSESPAHYEIPDVSQVTRVILTEAKDVGWEASIGNADLERVDGGWANAFFVPVSASGDAVVTYSRSPIMLASLIGTLVFWALMIGAAFPSRTNKARGRR